jgi:tetratricopeptide (TPR) repeat protein
MHDSRIDGETETTAALGPDPVSVRLVPFEDPGTFELDPGAGAPGQRGAGADPGGERGPQRAPELAAELDSAETASVETAGLAVGSMGGGGSEAEPGPAPRIGRYSVLRELGRGGMGVTYIAFDEELDRRVVLKLVRADAMDAQLQKRLRREAQALARLAHPNIVNVHDVGSHGARSFIAMEFVPGKTVSAWLGTDPRPWTEVVAVFRQAGEGLRAAHAAGLVHRDIKPANIIVGDDGRVRVLDFGVAQIDVPDDDITGLPDRQEAPWAAEHLTKTGSLVGTPAYMAPEQLERGIADARSDQFAFCVSLFQCLYRKLPFSGASARARLEAMHKGRIAEVPGDSAVPHWLHAVILRGLKYAPEDRWPSMDALLEELARDPARTRRRWAIGVLGASIAALGTVAVIGLTGDDRGAAVCTGAPARIAEVWNQGQKTAIEQAMLGTGVSYAADTWQRTRALLDRYAEQWAAAHTDACEATAVRHEQSVEVLDRRMQCLAGRRRSLRSLAGELARIDAASIANATEAAGKLPLIASCADPEYLSTRIEPPTDPAVAAQVEELESILSRAEQLQELGRYEQGLAAARMAFEGTAGLGYPPLEGHARLRLGMLQLAGAEYEPAEDNLEQAYFIARTAGANEVAFQAATQLVFLLGYHLSRLDDAGDWGRHVQAELPWVTAEAEQANSINTLGVLAFLQGKHEEAIALCRRALVIWERVLGPEHPRLADALDNIGVMLHAHGKWEEAIDLHRRSLAISEQALGAEHPHVVYPLVNLAGALYRQARYEEAAVYYRRALTIVEDALGSEHPDASHALIGLALVHLRHGRGAEALPLAERASAVLEKNDASPENLAEAQFVLARALAATGQDQPRALALARQAREVLQAASAPLSLIELADVEAWLRAHEPRP